MVKFVFETVSMSEMTSFTNLERVLCIRSYRVQPNSKTKRPMNCHWRAAEPWKPNHRGLEQRSQLVVSIRIAIASAAYRSLIERSPLAVIRFYIRSNTLEGPL